MRSPLSACVLACVVLAGLSLLVPSTLTYDPFTWANWARQLAHGGLDSRLGPAWKPLPVLLDLPMAGLGHAAAWTWLVLARAGGFLAVVLCYRLTRRTASAAASLFAAGAMVLSTSFVFYLLAVGMSEPLLAGLALLAIERHLDNHYGQAAALVYACVLLRPSYAPFLLVYGVFVWMRVPRSKAWLVAGAVALPIVVFVPDYLGSGDWFRSARRAAIPSEGGPLLTGHPGLATLQSAANQVIVPVLVGAAIAVVLVVRAYWTRREDGLALALIGISAGALVWEAALTQAKKSAGDPRYLIVGYAVACVVAGVGWDRAVTIVGRTWQTPHATRLAAAAVVVFTAPFAWTELAKYPSAARSMSYQAHKDGQLAAIVARTGRRRLLSCGAVMVDTYQAAALAWDLDVPVSRISIIAPPRGGVPTGPRADAARIERTPLPWAKTSLAPTGTLFRTATFGGGMSMTPRAPEPPAGFHVTVRTGQWEVWSTC